MANETLRLDDDRGATIALAVGVSIPHAKRATQLGRAVPRPEIVHGRIDTGVGSTIIDVSLALRLGLETFGEVDMHTPSTGS
jgi:hypothetical protein